MYYFLCLSYPSPDTEWASWVSRVLGALARGMSQGTVTSYVGVMEEAAHIKLERIGGRILVVLPFVTPAHAALLSKVRDREIERE